MPTDLPSMSATGMRRLKIAGMVAAGVGVVIVASGTCNQATGEP